MSDVVNHPPHYNAHPSGVECITVTEHMGFNLGNANNYLWRQGHKGAALEDLRKAVWYLRREVARRTTETWAEFPDDPRYEVSSAGRVRRAGDDRERCLVRIKSGYLTFATRVDGRAVTHYAHRAVARTFFGPIPKGQHVCHMDGDRSNNHVTNLRIDTPRGNARDRKRHGTHYTGADMPSARLTADLVLEIRQRPSETEVALGAEYGVSRATIGRIRRGESWTDPRHQQTIAFERWLEEEPGGATRDAIELIVRANDRPNAVETLGEAIEILEAEVMDRAIDLLQLPADVLGPFTTPGYVASDEQFIRGEE